MCHYRFPGLISILLLLAFTGCALSNPYSTRAYTTRAEKSSQIKNRQGHEAARLWYNNLLQTAAKRGYITIDELNKAVQQSSAPSGTKVWDWNRGPARRFFTYIIEENYLPFKAMFHLALEKEDYDEAELIRRNWVTCLNAIARSVDIINGSSPNRVGEIGRRIHSESFRDKGFMSWNGLTKVVWIFHGTI